MKNTRLFLSAIFCFLTTGIILQSCIQSKQKKIAEITSTEADTTVYLKSDSKSSPSCKIHLKYTYLKPASTEDSLSVLINTEIQEKLFGEKMENLSPEALTSQIVNDYITSYKTDVQKLYEADIYNGMQEQDIPAWYNYEYNINTEMSMGKDSIWNYIITTFQSTGGAHPNTYSQWLNIDATTGHLLTAEDVFRKDAETPICNLILKALLKEVNSRMETDTIQSLDDLQEAGILLNTDLYIPENFLIGKNGISFLYNRYDIAPYATGEFNLTIPYNEIETYLNK